MTIDNSLIRARAERLHAEGTSYSEMARRCGYLRYRDGNVYGECNPLLRAIGIKTPAPCHGRSYQHKKLTIKYDTAVRICRALHIDPVEVGL